MRGKPIDAKRQKQIAEYASAHGDTEASKRFRVPRGTVAKYRYNNGIYRTTDGKVNTKREKAPMGASAQAIVLLRQARAAMPAATKLDRAHLLAPMALDALNGA